MGNEKVARKNVLKNKNFALLFGGVLVSNIAHILFYFAMSLYVLRLATSYVGENNAPLIQGYYLLTAGIILLILMPFGGVLADRHNKVKTMYITDFIRGFTILVVGLVIFLTDNPGTKIVLIFIMAIILGINAAFFQPASQSLLKFIVDEEDLQQASSYMQGSMNLQNLIGLILGGILYATIGIYYIFIINGVAYIISGITEIFIKYEVKENEETTTLNLVLKDIISGVKYVFKFKLIFVIIVVALFLNFFISPIYENAMPYFIEFGLKTEESYLFDSFMSVENWYSAILIASSISGIIMSLILSAQKPKEKYHKQINFSLISFVILCFLIGVVMSLYQKNIVDINVTLVTTLILMFLMGFMSVSFNVPVNVTIQKKVDKEHLGKVQSVLSVFSQALIPLSGLLGGVLISKVSIIALYIFSGVGMIISALWYIFNKNSKLI